MVADVALRVPGAVVVDARLLVAEERLLLGRVVLRASVPLVLVVLVARAEADVPLPQRLDELAAERWL